jgi:NDP-sugar pyrophosphorylase family protein
VDFGKDVFPRILREQIFCGHVIDGRCLGIDTPDALSSAQAFLREEEGVAG